MDKKIREKLKLNDLYVSYGLNNDFLNYFNYEFIQIKKTSRSSPKKLQVIFKVNDQLYKINFGDKRYDHYYDKTGLLDKKFNHLDKDRRKRYLTRASKIKDFTGFNTVNSPFSPNFYSVRLL